MKYFMVYRIGKEANKNIINYCPFSANNGDVMTETDDINLLEIIPMSHCVLNVDFMNR